MKKLMIPSIVLILSIFFGSVNAQNVLQKAKNKLASAGGNNEEFTKEDNGEGITGPLHEKYKGKIVFGRTRVTRDMPESKFDTTFTLGEPIYARAFVARGIGDYYVSDPANGVKYTNYSGYGMSYTSKVYTMAYVDGAPLLNYPINSDEHVQNDQGKYLTTYQIFFFSNAEDGGNSKELIAALNKLSDGKHRVRLESFAGSGPTIRTTKKPIAVGEFNIVKKGPVKLGRTFSSLQPGMKDVALEGKILKVSQAHGKKNGWKESFTKAKVKSEGWTIIRNSISGVILGRSISAWVYAVWPDGKCTYQEFSFKQDHDGSKFMDNTYFEGTGTQVDCDCE